MVGTLKFSLLIESGIDVDGGRLGHSVLPGSVWCNLQIVSWEGECGWGSRNKILEIEELATVSFVRNLAALIFSKKLITVARDQVVGFVSKPARQHLHNRGESAPDSTQLLENLNRSIGASYKTFVGLRIVQPQVHRIQDLWVDSVPFEHLACKLPLQ